MRTTINLDDDVHAFARVYAESHGISLGEAMNELVRKTEVAKEPEPKLCFSPITGLPMFPSRGGVLTPELIRQIEEEEYAPKAFA